MFTLFLIFIALQQHRIWNWWNVVLSTIQNSMIFIAESGVNKVARCSLSNFVKLTKQNTFNCLLLLWMEPFLDIFSPLLIPSSEGQIIIINHEEQWTTATNRELFNGMGSPWAHWASHFVFVNFHNFELTAGYEDNKIFTDRITPMELTFTKWNKKIDFNPSANDIIECKYLTSSCLMSESLQFLFSSHIATETVC